MTDLAFTVTRIGFLIALWLLVLGAVAVLRKDIYGTMVTPRGKGRSSGKAPKTAPTSQPHNLLVTGGPLTGTLLPLGNSPITIGRSPASTLVIEDPYASSRHTVLENVNGDWIISDQGSTNGTFVDDERLTEPLRLTPGVTVRVGQTTFELVK
ncbi:FHA domain-containing protein [Actinomycetaceae bacterium WB03_NA08]|uniref:FHA domain-containing protein n=1 Tax=Scrofimicrobium canadense TaxID=2652290 RepID=A0A6N7W738_9ACTO|nr:FHA domain-containing protein [Scrofimicrobium canadense]MSS84056.1 FHA domain-containing protein [Scrofimicrobium canadense]